MEDADPVKELQLLKKDIIKWRRDFKIMFMITFIILAILIGGLYWKL